MENLEFIVWGANSATPGSWEEGKIVSIYRDGFDTANTEVGHSDDYASRWQFTQGYTFFRVTSGDHWVGGPFSPGEGEIDALVRVSAVPEPSALLLLGSGLAGLVGWSMRKRA
jgi:PEP-CTERM putative exosortase interaction domain